MDRTMVGLSSTDKLLPSGPEHDSDSDFEPGPDDHSLIYSSDGVHTVWLQMDGFPMPLHNVSVEGENMLHCDVICEIGKPWSVLWKRNDPEPKVDETQHNPLLNLLTPPEPSATALIVHADSIQLARMRRGETNTETKEFSWIQTSEDTIRSLIFEKPKTTEEQSRLDDSVVDQLGIIQLEIYEVEWLPRKAKGNSKRSSSASEKRKRKFRSARGIGEIDETLKKVLGSTVGYGEDQHAHHKTKSEIRNFKIKDRRRPLLYVRFRYITRDIFEMEEGEKRDREEKKRKRGERFGGGGGSNGSVKPSVEFVADASQCRTQLDRGRTEPTLAKSSTPTKKRIEQGSKITNDKSSRRDTPLGLTPSITHIEQPRRKRSTAGFAPSTSPPLLPSSGHNHTITPAVPAIDQEGPSALARFNLFSVDDIDDYNVVDMSGYGGRRSTSLNTDTSIADTL